MLRRFKVIVLINVNVFMRKVNHLVTNRGLVVS